MKHTQIRAARAALGWSRGRLAREAGISFKTVAYHETRADAGEDARARLAMVETLTRHGIEVLPDGRIAV